MGQRGRLTVHVLAGPNGAGKSTLAERVILPSTHLPFVNADVLAAQLGLSDANGAYRAAELAAQERDRLLAGRESFVTEAVFSHPSEVELLRAARAAGLGPQLPGWRRTAARRGLEDHHLDQLAA